MGVGRFVLLGVAVLLASSVPFVPTGEMVSGAAAYVAHEPLEVAVVYVVVTVASVLGDTVLLLGSGWARGRLGPRQRAWLTRRKLAPAVKRARRAIQRHATQAVVTSRLVPGSRAPVIIALGTSRYPVGPFMAADLVGCAVWAAVYTALGAAGGRVAGHPVLGTALAVACAVVLGLLLGVVQRYRAKRGGGTGGEDRDGQGTRQVDATA